MDAHNHPKIPYISLCTGYEGIGTGLEGVIPNLRAIAYCEREAFAISNLVAKVENGLLAPAPIYTDVATFPFQEFYPIMGSGVVSAGFPCQPVSCAGKRKATEDERWLFDILCDGFQLMRPGVIFLENVDGLLSAKMPDETLVIAHIVTRLEEMDYHVEVGVFSASEVGAPHQRKRVFILARRDDTSNSLAYGLSDGSNGRELPDGDSGWTVSELPQPQQGRRSELRSEAGRCCDLHPWPSRPGQPQWGWEPPRVTGVGQADGQDDGRNRRTTTGGDNTNEYGMVKTPERFIDGGATPRSDEQNLQHNKETQSPLGGDTHGPTPRLDLAELSGLSHEELAEIYRWMEQTDNNRVDELRLLGNGVVPATAERAWRVLWGRVLGNASGVEHR